jgi:hypothetical protein
MAQAARVTDEEVEVFAWLSTALRWFLAMSGQWRRDAAGRVTGLDYGCAEALARLEGSPGCAFSKARPWARCASARDRAAGGSRHDARIGTSHRR